MTTPWSETVHRAILWKKELKHSFTADQFVLFFLCLPDKRFNLGSEKCSGGKKSDNHLTK